MNSRVLIAILNLIESLYKQNSRKRLVQNKKIYLNYISIVTYTTRGNACILILPSMKEGSLKTLKKLRKLQNIRLKIKEVFYIKFRKRIDTIKN